MLSLKNPFAKSTPTPSSTESSMPAENDPNKAVKRWQLEQGRTRKRVEELVGQLEAARVALAQSEQTLGERIADELDSTTATDAMKHAADHARALEVALAVATEKDATAQAELTDAELRASIAADDEVVETFLVSVVKLDTLLCGEQKSAAEGVSVALHAVRDQCEGDSGVMHQLGRFLSIYPTYLLHANAALVPKGRRYINDIDRDQKTLSIQALAVSYAMTHRHRSR